jgi:hypothetical protein
MLYISQDHDLSFPDRILSHCKLHECKVGSYGGQHLKIFVNKWINNIPSPIATETGPCVATAIFSFSSLPSGKSTNPVSVAPTSPALKRHFRPVCKIIRIILAKFNVYLCFIRITIFGVDSIIVFDILKSIVHQSSIASHISIFF